MDSTMFVGEGKGWSCKVKKDHVPEDDYFLMTIECEGNTLFLFLESVADLKILRDQLQKQIDKEAPDADNE